MKTERIGLFGGTFNPIHWGHLVVARDVQKKFRLDKVLFIPSFLPPHKSLAEVAPARHRLRMVQLACRGQPKFFSSSLEVRRPKKSYSIWTLRQVRKKYPGAQIFFLLGIDAFLEIPTWKEYRKVLDECHFIVMSRPGYRFQDAAAVLGKALRSRVVPLNRGQRLREPLGDSPRIFFLPVRQRNISSREVRRRVRQGLPLRKWVPEIVEEYIRKNNLYQGEKKRSS